MTPPAVLVARLEHELEAIRLANTARHYVSTRDGIDRAIELAKQLRESL